MSALAAAPPRAERAASLDARRARRIAFTLALILPLLQTLTVLLGPALARPHEVFLGFGHLGLDFMAYASFLEQAREGSGPLLRNEFTVAPQAGRYILPIHWLIGRASALLGASITSTWLLAQIALGAGFLLGVWRFLGLCFTAPASRLIAYVLGAATSGFSGVARLLGSADDGAWRFVHPNLGWSGFGVLCNPLWTGAYLLLLAVLGCMFVALRTGRVAPLAPLPLLVTLVALAHGYTGLALVAILCAAAAWETVQVLRGREQSRMNVYAVLWALACFAIPFAISAWQSGDAVYRMTSARALAGSEAVPLWVWPLTFGPILAGALGVPGLLHDGRFAARLIGVWIVAIFALTQIPALSPERSVLFLHLPLCISAVHWLERAHLPAALRSPRVLLSVLVLLSLPSLAALASSVRDLRARPGYFLPRATLAGLEQLHALPHGNVMASGASSLYVPWLARKPVYVGHWFMSFITDPATGDGTVNSTWRFFGAHGPPREAAWRAELLRRNQIRWVVVGPEERKLGPGIDPRLGLALRADLGEVKIYEVGRPVTGTREPARDDAQ